MPAGLGLQIVGLALWAVSFHALGRSFGLVPADRGLVTRGPSSIVRHPLCSSYMLTQLGYLLQSASLWNGAVLQFMWRCQVARTVPTVVPALFQSSPLTRLRSGSPMPELSRRFDPRTSA